MKIARPAQEEQIEDKQPQPHPRADRRQPTARSTMSRILLVDDSPHAQRMGERILTEEGYEVVTVSNADSALIRLDDVDPDVVLADTVMPGRTGFEICQYLKMSPRHRHVRVILTAGVLETLDEAAAATRGGRRHAEEAVRSQRPAGRREAAGRSGRRGSRGHGPAREPGSADRAPDCGGWLPLSRWWMRSRCAPPSRWRWMRPWTRWSTRSRAGCWRR